MVYGPLNCVYCYRIFLTDGKDQFFQPLRHSARAYLESLPAGLKYNSGYLWRYLREWGTSLVGEHGRQVWLGRRIPREPDWK